MNKAVENFRPTVFMVKKHEDTNLLYFCKTVRLDSVNEYCGSGVRWTRHLNKYGKKVSNLWVSEVFDDPKKAEEFGLEFSKQHNIVESKCWANLVVEDGLMGGDTSAYANGEAISKALKGRKKSVEHIQALKGALKRPGAKERRSASVAKTKQSVEWKESVGYDSAAKMKRTRNSQEYINQHHKMCEHCGKLNDPGNYKRWHGQKCKSVKITT